MRRLIITGLAIAASLFGAAAADAHAKRCASSDATVRIFGGATCADARAVKRALHNITGGPWRTNIRAGGRTWDVIQDAHNMEHLILAARRSNRRVDIVRHLS